MAATIEEICSFLDEEDLQYQVDEDRQAVLVGFTLSPSFTGYRDREGESHFGVVIHLSEEGEFLALVAPWTWGLADCRHKPAVFELLATYQSQHKAIRFEYDPDDGELRSNVELCLEDAPLTYRQFRRMLTSLGHAVFRVDPVVRHAMRTGEICFDLLDNLREEQPEADLIRGLAEQAGGLEALERLIGGGEAAEAEATDPSPGDSGDPGG